MDKKCTVYKTADLIGKRWTILILLELYKGSTRWKRYSQIRKKIPEITPKILSARLKELADKKMITKKISAKTFPIKCEYILTKKGDDFIKIIKEIKKWSLKWDIRNTICKNTECKKCEF